MNVTVRLYRQHDMDLIHLCRQENFPFAKTMKAVLVSFANGRIYEPEITDETPKNGYVKKLCQFHFVLNPDKEEEQKAIEMLANIKKGLRNSFMKALFRSCIPYLPLKSFVEGDGLIMKRDPMPFSYVSSALVKKQKALAEDMNEHTQDEGAESDEKPAPSDATPVPPVVSGTDTEESESDDLFAALSALSH